MSAPSPKPASRRWRYVSLLWGALLLSALVVAASRFGEIESFIELARRTRPGCLLLAACLQFGT